MTLKSGTGRSVIAKVESSWGVAAGASGAKKFRRTGITLNLKKDRYSSNEIRDDYQKVRASSGGERVEGNIDAELSCGSHQEFFEGAMREVAAAIADLTTLTLDVAGAGPTYTITRGSGDFIAGGLRVGVVFRATAGLAAGNLGRNLLITALSTTVLTVYPLDGQALSAESGTTGCTLHVPGKRLTVPSTGHIERSFTCEDLVASDISRQFLGIEVNGISCDFSPGANAKASFAFIGKSMVTDTSAYFTSPAALGTAPVLSGPKGVILIDGAVVAIVTQLTLNPTSNLSTEPVIGSTSAPAIGQGPFTGKGQLTLLLLDASFITKFKDDTPFEVLAYLKETAAADTDFMTFHMADCLASSADLDDGEKLLKQTIPFDFTKKPTATGYDSTTMAVQDSRYV